MTPRPFLLIVGLWMASAVAAFSHCQIPCGIYDDDARFKEMAEHITTIEKSIKLIEELSAKGKLSAQDQNQLVRWVANKEQHADAIAEIVTQYFLQQRIKPAPEGDDAAAKKYATHLSLLHQLLVGSMKAKQQASLDTVAALRKALAGFEKAYKG